jgi:hypothetical protein
MSHINTSLFNWLDAETEANMKLMF